MSRSRIEVTSTDYGSIRPFHEQNLAGVAYQVVHATVLPRGLADPYLIRIDGRAAGYGAVWNSYFPHRAVDFFCAPDCGADHDEVFRAFLVEGKVLSLEAQTNMPATYPLLARFGKELRTDKILFEDHVSTAVRNPGVEVSEVSRSSAGSEWILRTGNGIVARGGYMTHYNPPFADIYIEVEEYARGRGMGSFLVQELKGICRRRGLTPVARCDPDNVASRRTLERAGLRECARLVSSEVDPRKVVADRSVAGPV